MSAVIDPVLQALTRRIGGALQGALQAPAEPGPAVLQPPSMHPIAPQLLARSHPTPKARQDMQALYQRCLKHFRQRVQQSGDQDDAALAAAYFVVSNLVAAQGLDPAAAPLAAVERQMRHLLGRLGGWAQAPLRDRQSAFEQFAVIGVLVSETDYQARRQGAAALANVQRAARGYLVQLLGVAPERLQLGEQGLVLELAAA